MTSIKFRNSTKNLKSDSLRVGAGEFVQIPFRKKLMD
jgi:hypothetical protein